MTSLSRSKASFRPFILLRSRALAATRRFRNTVGDGGRVDFFRPPRPFFFTGGGGGAGGTGCMG